MANTSTSSADQFLRLIGLGYLVGAVGGSSCHFLKALRSSPNGQRVISGIHSVCMNAPSTVSSFAFWGGGIFTASAWTLSCLRQKDDLWNSVIAGSVSGMLYKMRRGLVPACKFGMWSGAVVCTIEGVFIMMQPSPDQHASLFSNLLADNAQPTQLPSKYSDWEMK